MPAAIRDSRPLIRALRHDYAHIDERALGRTRGKRDPSIESRADFLWYYEYVVVQRKLTDGNRSISIDSEATDLCMAARDYLLDAWAYLISQARRAIYDDPR